MDSKEASAQPPPSFCALQLPIPGHKPGAEMEGINVPKRKDSAKASTAIHTWAQRVNEPFGMSCGTAAVGEGSAMNPCSAENIALFKKGR